MPLPPEENMYMHCCSTAHEKCAWVCRLYAHAALGYGQPAHESAACPIMAQSHGQGRLCVLLRHAEPPAAGLCKAHDCPAYMQCAASMRHGLWGIRL